MPLIYIYDPNNGTPIRDGEIEALIAGWSDQLARGETVEATVANATVMAHLRLAVCEERIAAEQLTIRFGEVETGMDPYGFLTDTTLPPKLLGELYGFDLTHQLLRASVQRRRRDQGKSTKGASQ